MASDDTLQVAAWVEHQGRKYTVGREPADTRLDYRTGWPLLAGDARIADLPMHLVMAGYTPRVDDLVAAATEVLDDLAPFMNDAGVVDWSRLATASAQGLRLKPITDELLADRRKAEDRRRQKLAEEHERLRREFFSGMKLGMWAGRGDYSTLKMDFRDESGVLALAEFDAEIAKLVEFRDRLANAISPTNATAESASGDAE